MVQARGAVLRRVGAPPSIETIEVGPLGLGDMLVRVRAARPAGGVALSVEAVRPGGHVIWLGKVGVADPVTLRWRSLMQEKRVVRCSYGGARPQEDFPLLAQAYLDGKLRLDEMISARVGLEEIDRGFDALRRGAAIRSVVMLGDPP